MILNMLELTLVERMSEKKGREALGVFLIFMFVT
jgi:hypothetical protein